MKDTTRWEKNHLCVRMLEQQLSSRRGVKNCPRSKKLNELRSQREKGASTSFAVERRGLKAKSLPICTADLFLRKEGRRGGRNRVLGLVSMNQ